jgi:hypothetical protein
MSVSVVIAAYNVQECIPEPLRALSPKAFDQRKSSLSLTGLPIEPEMLLGILQEPT